jgi:lysophospholipase L1-like esterase
MPTHDSAHSDDSLMDRFDRAGLRRFRARDAVIAAAIVAVILLVTSGASIKKQGEEETNRLARDAVLAVGRPAAWLSGELPAQGVAHSLTGWLSPDLNLGSYVGFTSATSSGTTAGGIPLVTPDAFDPRTLGAAAPPRPRLRTMLVTGDSMSEPLDQYLAQDLDPDGVRVVRDPHIGTGISSTLLVNWAKLAEYQAQHDHPGAVVVFIGANDGYSMPGPGGRIVNCCSAEWAAIYANRVRQMMSSYRQGGAARVYWLTLPTPRSGPRAQIAHVVNAAIEVAAQPWADQVRVIDMVPVFTPNGYRDSVTIGGQPTIVRESDGIHLNNAGSQYAAKVVLGVVDRDYAY